MAATLLNPFASRDLRLRDKLLHFQWPFVLLVCAVAAVGFAMLYSAAGASFEPWAGRQMVRFGFGILMLVAVGLVEIRLWIRYAYAGYALALLLLLAVEIMGDIGMGAQRWLDFGFVSIQPSEVMKIALVLALARYFHSRSMEDIGRPLTLVAPALMIAVPAALVLRQPDLGTALLLMAVGAAMFFIAGVRLWKFLVGGGAAVAAIPFAWQFLHEYQRQRVRTFFNPESDPLGSGYHIIQSKIALGSGGMFGRGYLEGTQSHLNFLPEKHTDFIFTMLAEEFGLAGALTLVGAYALLIAYGFAISVRARSHFARLVGLGVTTLFFFYVFINIAMVMGLIPVVGVPLPLVSYGGTALLSTLFGFGLLMNAWVHRDTQLGRHAADDL